MNNLRMDGMTWILVQRYPFSFFSGFLIFGLKEVLQYRCLYNETTKGSFCFPIYPCLECHFCSVRLRDKTLQNF